MKRILNLCVLHLALALFPVGALRANEASGGKDRTLSPYFHVQGGDGGADLMPLKSTEVDVQIAGVIADVRITQVYSNAGGMPLEAIYVFPGSTQAAIYGMEMTIGERVLKAQVQPRDTARRTFEQAKSEGKSTSLLEQQRPNVFQMNVANIMPGETIKVDLRYTELLVPNHGEYEFVFPTVVGPRYSNKAEASAPETDRWIANPYLQKSVQSSATFKMAVDVVAGMPLQALQCASHEVEPEYRDASHARITLDGSASSRDFILKYRLADSKIESGLLLSRGETENFFLLTVQPPSRVKPEALPPREYVFVVDVSGSMKGFPLEVSKRLMKQLFATLSPQDTFNVLLFSGGSDLLSERSMPASHDNLKRAFDVIDSHRGGGGTELLPALRRVLELPSQPDTVRSIVVITDGFVSVETEAFDLIRKNLNRANLFAFGIGSSVNRFIIEGMARAGQGEPFIVTRPDEAESASKLFRDYISAPVLTRVAVDFSGFEAYDVEPASIPDVLADRPVVLFGKWKGSEQGSITLRGKSGVGEYVQSFRLADATSLNTTQALGYLWARKRIATLADYIQLGATDERVKEVTNLGLTYNLLTVYTSFVAVDNVVRNPAGGMESIKQPLPLPLGVENSAVGAPISTTPEPETWMLMGALILVIAVKIYRSRKVTCV
jgi:Ca-activated chloride channel family protein